MKKSILLASALPLVLSACGSATMPNIDFSGIQPAYSRIAPSPIEVLPLESKEEYARQGGPEDPSFQSMQSVSIGSKPIPSLELFDVSIKDLAKLLVVDHSGLALAVSGDLSARVDWSGGPFSVDDALAALEEISVANSLSYRKIGEVVSISSGEGSKAVSVGYTRVYRSSAQAITEALSQLFSRVKTASVGRTVSVSGSSADITHSLNLIRSLDRDSVSSLPWSVVKVSPEIADQAVEIVSSLADPSDPLAVRAFSVEDKGLIMLVGYNRATVSEAEDVLKSLSGGLQPLVSRVLPVGEPDSVLSALQASFAPEIGREELIISSSSNELVLRGSPNAVGQAFDLAKEFSSDLGFVDIRAVVAETTRGSAVDKAITISGTGISLSSGQGGGQSVGFSSGGFDAAVEWLDRDTKTQLLSTSSLSIRSGKKGDMSVGDQVPVPGVETMNDDGTRSRSTEYRDTGVQLKVSPRILSDGRISVVLEQEISTAGTNTLSGIDAPTFGRRALSTELVIEPGELVAAGGLDYQTSDEYKNEPFSFAPGGSSSSRKLVILLSASVKDSYSRRSAVQDQLSGISDILKLEEHK